MRYYTLMCYLVQVVEATQTIAAALFHQDSKTLLQQWPTWGGVVEVGGVAAATRPLGQIPPRPGPNDTHHRGSGPSQSSPSLHTLRSMGISTHLWNQVGYANSE